jgi:DNA gyrase subunit A
MARPKASKDAPQLALNDADEIEQIDVLDTLESDFFDYAMAVQRSRALPDVRDGMKPVHRRIIWDMEDLGFSSTRPHVKSARTTGDTMARFHPHGNASIYDALARMAQPFSMRCPLIDFHGNYGSPDFGPAAERYTESRLHPNAEALLLDVNAGAVPFVDNYDGEFTLPAVLPAGFPNLLINGSQGIAVGLTSALPTHNPLEVIAAAQHLITNPRATIEEIIEFIPGPDYPQPAVVVNGTELAEMYRTGLGRVMVRGCWHVEDGARGAKFIVVTSLPYTSGKTGSADVFMEKLADGVDGGTVLGVSSFNNESADGQTRIVIKVAAGIDPEVVMPGILANTNLQVSNPVQMHFLDDLGRPKLFNLLTSLDAWINHRVEVIRSRSLRRISLIDVRVHKLDGYLLALLDIDETIRIVRTSKSRAVARPALMERFGLDEDQANAVLDLTLGQLTEDARFEFEQEAKILRAERAKLDALVNSPTKLRRQVGTELESTAKLFEGEDRRTIIASETLVAASKAAFILDEPTAATLFGDGTIVATREGARNKAPKTTSLPVRSFETSTASNMIIVTAGGKLFRATVASLPTDKPTAAVNVFPGLEKDDHILGWWAESEFVESLVLVTSDGSIKRIDDLAGGDRKGGISIIKLDAGEALVAVFALDEDVPVLIITAGGQGIRFVPADVRAMGRTASGVRGIKLAAGDRVVGAVPAGDGGAVLVAHDAGGVKRVACSDFPQQGRAGKGVKASVVGGRHGKVSLVAVWTDEMLVQVGDQWLPFDVKMAPLVGRDAAPSKSRLLNSAITAVV